MEKWPQKSIGELRIEAVSGGVRASVRGQVDRLIEKETKTGKPYYEFVLRDAGDAMGLKVWQDHPAFPKFAGMSGGEFVVMSGEWSVSTYGMEARDWSVRILEGEEIDEVLAGSEAVRSRLEADWRDIVEYMEGLGDPRLRAVAGYFIEEYGERFRRTAAARNYHHARRGGLVEHVAQMMRSAEALCRVYPGINRDLVMAGVLFHDCGKMWENHFPRDSFSMPHTEMGELLGHIPIGMELANKIWREVIVGGDVERWRGLEPDGELVRLHLLHLIGAHHGEMAFGSPVLPRTPEAVLLHHIDNIDAKLEMMYKGYETSPELAPGIYERVRPLPSPLVRPLAAYLNVDGGQVAGHVDRDMDGGGEVGERPSQGSAETQELF